MQITLIFEDDARAFADTAGLAKEGHVKFNDLIPSGKPRRQFDAIIIADLKQCPIVMYDKMLLSR
jgi:hypothetical protein